MQKAGDRREITADRSPGQLPAPVVEQAKRFVDTAESKKTERTRDQALRYVGAWYELRFDKVLMADGPMTPEEAVTFVTDHVEQWEQRQGQWVSHGTTMPPGVLRDLQEKPGGGQTKSSSGLKARGITATLGSSMSVRHPLKLSTVEKLLYIVSAEHKKKGILSPVQSPGLAELLKKVRKSTARANAGGAKKGMGTKKAPALTADLLLEKVLPTIEEDTLVGLRDRALLLVGFASGGRRRSEMAAMRFEHLEFDPLGRWATVLVAVTKTTAELDDRSQKPIMGEAFEALKAWIRAAKITAGPLFRAINRNVATARGISENTIYQVVKDRCRHAGLGAKFSAHSLRAGFATEAGRQGVNPVEAMKLTGHTSLDVYMGYQRAGELTTTKAANLLSGAKAKQGGEV